MQGHMWRKALIIFSLGVLMLVMTLSASQAASKITIEAITAWPKNTFMVENFTTFMDSVNEKAAKQYPGEFEIKYKG